MNVSAKKQRKAVQLYLQAVSSICISGTMASYYTWYPYGKVREGFLGKAMLARKVKKEWGISDTQTFLHRLGWYLNEGNRAPYDLIVRKLALMSETQRQAYIAALPADQEQANRTRIAHFYLRKLPPGGIAALDYAWYIHMCRVGSVLGYLNEAEARKRMLKAARLLQQAYGSWNEYLGACVAGHHFTLANMSLDMTRTYFMYISLRFAGPNSPFRQVDWNVDLQGAYPIDIIS
ncbi:DUF1266 domain-containing protein [Paenibacillus sp. y28]|uniref:DUF1266 domain-containing protein n=1 Tax=Paenibacillus sp. y28 TaxID=3129110 RepID=UPI003019E97E